jgi:hypothetical protein
MCQALPLECLHFTKSRHVAALVELTVSPPPFTGADTGQVSKPQPDSLVLSLNVFQCYIFFT